MRLSPDLDLILYAPDPTRGIEVSAEERAAFTRLHSALINLMKYTRDFIAAVALFDYCGGLRGGMDNELRKQWRFIAAREGAMSLYHHAYTMDLIRGSIKPIHSLKGLIDLKRLKSLKKEYDVYFPKTEQLRHAIAHSSDLLENEAKAKNNIPEGHGFFDSILNDVYMSSIKKQTFGYRVNFGSAKLVADFTLRLFSEFPDPGWHEWFQRHREGRNNRPR